MRRKSDSLNAVLYPFCAGFLFSSLATSKAESWDFNRHIRPILSEHCFTCHGPDQRGRKAGLRLDTQEGAFAVLEEGALWAIHPGDVDRSEVARRILSDDPDEVMPPAETKMELTDEEKDRLLEWIADGAPFEDHWAFQSVSDVDVPDISDPWIRNEIDAFVLRRLSEADLPPQEEAAPETLVRRLYLDFVGRPPTIGELDQYLGDTDPNRYSTLIERLIHSKEYAERMTNEWLDVARFADTYGYQADRFNHLWPWRDWVLRAFDQKLPYDDFITWQIAGDLLPNPTSDQVLATAFNRNHRQTNEGGSTPEEFRVEYNADRVETTSMAFLGLTMGCARCHDHKYDPISQKDYYSFFGFFNSTDEAGLYSHFTDAIPSPTLLLYEGDQEERHRQSKKRIRELEDRLTERSSQADEAFEQWLSSTPTVSKPDDVAAAFAFDEWVDNGAPNAVDPEAPGKLSDGPQLVDGKFGKAVEFSGDNSIDIPSVSGLERIDPFSIDVWLWIPEEAERIVVLHQCQAYTDAGSRGYELLLEEGKAAFGLIHFMPGNAIKSRTAQALPLKQWLRFTATYDGSSRAQGIRLYLDGKPLETEIVRDNLFKTIGYGGAGKPLRLAARMRDVGFKNGRMDDLSVYRRELSAVEVDLLGQEDASGRSLGDFDLAQLKEHFFAVVDPEAQQLREALHAARKEESVLIDKVREVMVMGDLPEPRPTFVLNRGVYDQPTDPVEPGVPESVFPFDSNLPRNRLGLAQWLTDPQHPLTARVTVNRYWALFFGQGLSRSPEDFGSQGEAPSHPDLLDWLAKRFIENGWDLQDLQRLIASSATYRQSSIATPEAMAQDPENRLLARAPSFRLGAELIRDSALSMAGLIEPKFGGPSVKTGTFGHKGAYNAGTDKREGLFRRSVYTYIQRTAPPPFLLTFDATSREACMVEREITNTPLQSLILLNDRLFNESARKMAERVLLMGEATEEEGLIRLFRQTTSRLPDPTELAILQEILDGQRNAFSQSPGEAKAYLDGGHYHYDEALEIPELAAWSAVAGALLNFDETISKR